jgi:1,2-diacylglycerol 3-beta-galactosyltransferase
MLSFLPGQEAGNVDVVLEQEFGDFCQDPAGIATEVGIWLKDTNLLDTMSRNAQKAGNPYAAREIVEDIGELTQTWMRLNSVPLRQ